MLELLRLIFDTGLLVLIWIVQLIIYPSFAYYAPKDLLYWHQKYTLRITIIVLPFMLGELIVILLQLFYSFSVYHILSGIFVLIIWINTFFQAIPLHQKIENNIDLKKTNYQLVQINWLRTILWTILFLMTCLQFIKI